MSRSRTPTGRAASSSKEIQTVSEFSIGDIVRPLDHGRLRHTQLETFSRVIGKWRSYGQWTYQLEKLQDPSFVFGGTTNTHTIVMTKERIAEVILFGGELNSFMIKPDDHIAHMSVRFDLIGGPIAFGNDLAGDLNMDVREGFLVTLSELRGPIRWYFKYIGNPVSGKVSVFKVDRNGHEEIWELAL